MKLRYFIAMAAFSGSIFAAGRDAASSEPKPIQCSNNFSIQITLRPTEGGLYRGEIRDNFARGAVECHTAEEQFDSLMTCKGVWRLGEGSEDILINLVKPTGGGRNGVLAAFIRHSAYGNLPMAVACKN